MWRIPIGLGLVALGVAGVYRLMVWDAHFLSLALFGTVYGAAAGWALAGRRAALAWAVVGCIAPLAYVPLWFVFDLPPTVGLDL